MAGSTLYEALANWKNREQNLALLFSDTSLYSPQFLKSKLKHFRELNDRYGREQEMKADVCLQVLRGEIKILERRLFPRIGGRLLQRFIANATLYFGPGPFLKNQNTLTNRQKEKNETNTVFRGTGTTAKLTPVKSMKSAISVSAREQPTLLTPTNVIAMIEKNYDYLSNQVKYTGFSEDLQAPLKENMSRGESQFVLTSKKDFGKDQTTATLHFRKSDESGMYFFNRYTLMLTNDQHPDAIKQTFFINPKDDNITLKEAYNLMSGRAVHKEISAKEGEKYKAWLQLDFKDTDPTGNYRVKQFHQNYGYDLQAALQKYPIKELRNETDAQRLTESLQRGNRQVVVLEINGKEQKVSVEAAPQFKSLNFYDGSNQRLHSHKVYEKPSQERVAIGDKKQSHKQNLVGDGSEPATEPKNKKRKRQNLN